MEGDIKAEQHQESLVQSQITDGAGPIDLTPVPDSASSITHSQDFPLISSDTSSDAPSNISLSNTHPNSPKTEPQTSSEDVPKPPTELVQIEIVKLEDDGADSAGELNADHLAPESAPVDSDPAASGSDEPQEWISENDSEMKRVKVCGFPSAPLCIPVWFLGTGNMFGFHKSKSL
jgi:hypothetical protein